METIDVWNGRMAEVTRKKDGDKKKEKSMTTDADTPPVEELLSSSETQENVIRNSIEDKDPITLSKKVKSFDNSDSMLILKYYI